MRRALLLGAIVLLALTGPAPPSGAQNPSPRPVDQDQAVRDGDESRRSQRGGSGGEPSTSGSARLVGADRNAESTTYTVEFGAEEPSENSDPGSPSAEAASTPFPGGVTCFVNVYDPRKSGAYIIGDTSVYCTGVNYAYQRQQTSLCRSRWYGCEVRATNDSGRRYERSFTLRVAAYCSGTTHNWLQRLTLEVGVIGSAPGYFNASDDSNPRISC